MIDAEKMVILHAGGGKTGSSALQSAFARNMTNLKQAGVYYPWASGVDHAATGATTSGNGQDLVAQICGPDPSDAQSFDIDAVIDAAEAEDLTKILISSEFLMSINPRKFLGFQENLTRRGYKCRVVYFIRSVFGHAISCYMQRVKGHQYIGRLDDFLAQEYINRFLQVIRKFRSMDIDFQLRNYDTVKRRLFPDFCTTSLDIDPSGMIPPDTVNRSLTAGEIEIFRCFNQICVAHGIPNAKSRPIIYNFLKIVPSFPTPRAIPAASLQQIRDKYTKDVEIINGMYPGFDLSIVPDDFDAVEGTPDLDDRNELIYNYIAALIYRQSFS